MRDATTDVDAELKFLLRKSASYEFAPDIGSAVLDAIDTLLNRYVIFPDDHARHGFTLWIAHCWLMDAWQATPRVILTSNKPSCGKSHALMIATFLTPYPDLTVDTTLAAFFSAVEETEEEHHGAFPTILFDEIDTLKNLRNLENMRGTIDGGFERGATVNRRIKGKRVKFSTYCPVAFGGKLPIGKVPDTIVDRAVVITMRRRDDEKVDEWNLIKVRNEATALKPRLRMWIEFVHERALNYWADLPKELRDSANRAAAKWRPLITVADLAGGRWPDMARAAAVADVAGVADVPSLPADTLLTLSAIQEIFRSHSDDKVLSEDLLAALKAADPTEYRSLSSKGLANLLSAADVRPKSYRVSLPTGLAVRRGYPWSRIADALSRHAHEFKEIEDAAPGASATSATESE